MTGWIDIGSGRLPETNEWVLVSLKLKSGRKVVEKAFYEPGLKAWWNMTGGEIEAWMPLPAPYEREWQ